MGDIDFLSQEKKDGDEEKKAPETDKDLKWSDPRSFSGYAEKAEKTKEAREAVDDGEISAWLKKLKSKSGEEMKGAKELKKSKEALAEYQQIFHKNKNRSESSAELKKAEPEERGHGLKNGIAEIIKNRLAFGSKKVRGEGDVIKTNLISGEGVTFFDWGRKVRTLVVNIVLTIVIIGTFYGFLLYKEGQINKKQESLSVSIAVVKEKIEKLSVGIEEVDSFQKKIRLAKHLLDKHVYWTNFFDFLEKNVLKTVFFEQDFNGNVNGFFKIYSLGSSFSDLTYQSRILRRNSDVVSDVSIVSGSAMADKEGKTAIVEFLMTLEINPDIFYK